MKQYIKMQFAVMLTFTLSLYSCNKKDSTPKPDLKTLLTKNTWQIIEWATDNNKNGVIDEDEFTPVPANDIAQITLLPDGSGTEIFYGSFNLRWSVLDQQTIRIVLDYTGTPSYNWDIKKINDQELEYVESNTEDQTITFGFHCVPK